MGVQMNTRNCDCISCDLANLADKQIEVIAKLVRENAELRDRLVAKEGK